MKTVSIAMLAMTLAVATAHAKLPPPSEEAQAAAAAAKAKADWSAKVAAYQLCQAQNRVAAQYLKKEGGKKPAADMPPCSDPGPFTPGAEAKPAQTAAASAKMPAKK